jgi:GNAT superfamily N-acetyltransferase
MMINVSCNELGPAHAWHLPAGERVRVRPASPQDAGTIQVFFHGLSPASRRNRFLGALNEVSASELYNMTHGDHGRHPLLIAEHIDDGFCKMISEARYAMAPGKLECEFAVSVAETWRRRTLGTRLITLLALRAKALGFRYLVGDVLRANEAMIALARKVGFRMTDPISDASLVRITKDLSLWSATRLKISL